MWMGSGNSSLLNEIEAIYYGVNMPWVFFKIGYDMAIRQITLSVIFCREVYLYANNFSKEFKCFVMSTFMEYYMRQHIHTPNSQPFVTSNIHHELITASEWVQLSYIHAYKADEAKAFEEHYVLMDLTNNLCVVSDDSGWNNKLNNFAISCEIHSLKEHWRLTRLAMQKNYAWQHCTQKCLEKVDANSPVIPTCHHKRSSSIVPLFFGLKSEQINWF